MYNPDEVAAVLRQIKHEIRSRRGQDANNESSAITTALAQADAASWVNPHQPVAWPTWPPGLWPKVIAVAQKVTRRLLRWYVDPIVEQQNQFNQAAVSTLMVLAQENARLRAELRAVAANFTASVQQ
jgi:hypothetical protein